MILKTYFSPALICLITLHALSLYSMSSEEKKDLEKFLFTKENWEKPAHLQTIKKIFTDKTKLAQLKNSTNMFNNNLAHMAAKYGDSETMQLLLTNMPNSNNEFINHANNQGDTPLIAATFSQTLNPQMIQILLDNKADKNSTNKDGGSALTYVAAYGTPELIKLLVDNYKFQVSLKQNFPPLVMAVFLQKIDNVRTLLELGTDSNGIRQNRTALYWAIYKYNEARDTEKKDTALTIARILLAHGANPDLQPSSTFPSARTLWKSYGLDDNLNEIGLSALLTNLAHDLTALAHIAQ
ncbi:MAG: ankyrin repeat domain-containing protein [Candidatus Babeliaceae bacterium]|jgi:ankyrin repeat protein